MKFASEENNKKRVRTSLLRNSAVTVTVTGAAAESGTVWVYRAGTHTFRVLHVFDDLRVLASEPPAVGGFLGDGPPCAVPGGGRGVYLLGI